MPDNTEQLYDNLVQQEVGGEDVRATLIKLVDGVRAVMVAGPRTDERVEEIAGLVTSAEQLISRHYIAKEAVAAAIDNQFNPSISQLELAERQHGELPDVLYVDQLKDALNLDSGTEAKQ